MTIVNPQYYDEIVNRLRTSGIEVHHFTLLANRETLLKRLRSREDYKDSWPARQMDRCISSLSQDKFKTYIHTDHLTPEEVLERIAGECNVELLPDTRGMIKKNIDRLVTKIKHIRI
ncbi:Tunicamycin resistance protein [compost metagenome]